MLIFERSVLGINSTLSISNYELFWFFSRYMAFVIYLYIHSKPMYLEISKGLTVFNRGSTIFQSYTLILATLDLLEIFAVLHRCMTS